MELSVQVLDQAEAERGSLSDKLAPSLLIHLSLRGPSNLINYQITLHSSLRMVDAKISFSRLIRALMTRAKSP